MEKKIRRYREYQILNIRHNQLYFSIFTPYFIGVSFSNLMNCLFGMIRLHDVLSLGLYLIFPVTAVASLSVLFILFTCASKVLVSSTLFLISLKAARCKSRILRRQIRALRSFGLRAGPLKSLRNTHFLYFLRAGADYAIAILELFK